MTNSAEYFELALARNLTIHLSVSRLGRISGGCGVVQKSFWEMRFWDCPGQFLSTTALVSLIGGGHNHGVDPFRRLEPWR
jgi:hypothetical protein